ncbi:MAB_1171c family putative transporter [Actinokineospora guangxiensis]|uniref:MAB_1171c family putative transporter n=1 Tax=Actinokineospora guangxiensis TaxID=1490288 RepID=A0ABW0EU63_9PSEU
MTSAVLLVVAAAVGIAATAVKLRHFLRDWTDPAMRALTVSCVALATAVAIQLPPVYLALNDAAGFNAAWPVQHVLAVLAAHLVVVFFLHSTKDTRTEGPGFRRRVNALGGVAIAASALMCGLFALDPGARDFVHGPGGLNDSGGSPTAAGAGAFLVFSVYLGTAIVVISRQSARWARKARHIPWLSAGLALVSAGTLFGFAYCLHKLLYQLATVAGWEPGWTVSSVEGWLMPAATALSASGVVLAASGAHLGRRPRGPVRMWWGHYRARRALYPLWHRFRTVMPEIGLIPPGRVVPDWLLLDNAAFRLRRAVVETWDGARHIRSLVPPEDPVALRAKELGERAGLAGDDLAAVITAATVEVGLRRRSACPKAEVIGAGPGFGGGDLADEVDWWRRVARAHRRSPIPGAVLAEYLEETLPRTADA